VGAIVETGSVGSRLKDARQARGLSLEDLVHATKIPRSTLQYLEADAFDRLPAPVFVRGFIRAYAKCSGVDPNPIVRAFEQRTSQPSLGSEGGHSGASATDKKLVPLEPVSERREGSFRRGYALLAIVAVGLLIAAWLMVGGRKPSQDASARGPSTTEGARGVDGGAAVGDDRGPALHERIEGVPTAEGRDGRRVR